MTLTAKAVAVDWPFLVVAALFLDTLKRMPFTSHSGRRVVGVPADFEAECQRRGIRLFVLPPRSPKLNGHVERAHRTHTEEFCEVWAYEIARIRDRD